MKFGGTSVADASAFERARRIVRARASESPVVVVSAMGGFTDALLDAAQTASTGDTGEAARSLDAQFARHVEVARALLTDEAAIGFEAIIEAARREVRAALGAVAGEAQPFALLQDEIVSYGERLSAELLARVLDGVDFRARCVDARRCVMTDGEHGRATPLKDETERRTRAELEPVIEDGAVPVMGGFIASSVDGVTTTLGRGGSDYTAALVGAALGAREIQIWTDVPGVLTADPRIVSEARTIPRLSYAEAAELAYFGAKVLHPKTILPAIVRNIPVRICDSRAADAPDTIVYFDAEMTPRTVKAIACKTGIHIVHVTSARMLGAYGFLRAIFEVFEKHRTVVDIVTTSEVSVSLSLEDTSALDEVVKDLEKFSAVRVERERAIVCVVGEGLRNTPGIAARVFNTIRDINVLLISQGASNINLTFVVKETRARETVRRLHEAFFECATSELLARMGDGH
jgi:aspartate kinase